MKLLLLTACSLGILSSQEVSAQEEPEVRFGTTVVISTGLQGNIFFVSEFTKKIPKLEKLDKKKPVLTIYTKSLNIPTQFFKDGFPGLPKRVEWFVVDYKGKFWIENPGRYKFILTSDDGSLLSVDERPVIDNDGIHPTMTRDGTIELAAGVHTMRVTYMQGPGYALALVLQIEPPGQPARIFNTDEYKPPSTLEVK